MGFTSLRDLLSHPSLDKTGMRRSIRAAMVVQMANRMIPGLMSEMKPAEVTAVSFKDGILRLRAHSTAARYAWKAVEPLLLEKLQREFPTILFKKIQVLIASESSSRDTPASYEFS